LIVVGLTLNSPGVDPVVDPLNETVRLLEAFDEIAILPPKLPDDCGANVTLNDALCPGVKVRGVLRPEMPKPAPVTET
jgi:hypothetical protein